VCQPFGSYRWQALPQTVEVTTPKAIICRIQEIAPSQLFAKKPVPALSATQVISVASMLTCPICMDLVQRPIELPCKMYVCSSCLIDWIKITLRLKCPCCYTATDLQHKDIKSAPELVLHLLCDVMVCCPTCSKDVKGSEYNTHKCSEQLDNTQQLRVTAETVNQLLCNATSNTIQIPTGGRVSYISSNAQVI